ncbi:MAG: MgtC/SapB family protein [Candidatus Scalindua sp. AMX11]|nr:MAG: MgtC/SapB family protein [Candidatus Scalindua sp.]NOG85325.1 MgtC/SapB family protein [Planctomycetota bacterium]RZV81460.1 MAG: MgtC/SapB family protein [Candidatus Scalindua sp. SCAELEC01]TDE65494.1 MAG: MgtC/SapB family protein [Candidatus Scalindua sp. AMX11]
MEIYLTITIRLLVSLLLGGTIGLERAFYGRPAGLRTHSLVCISSCLLMFFGLFQESLLSNMSIETIRIDPTRMAQGIMTGIGFLGAGVIMKERFSIRGLTTAASIWITAAIGIILGLGFYFPAALATILTLMVLSFFRWFERKLPVLRYGRLVLRFKNDEAMSKDDVIRIVEKNNIKGGNCSFYLKDEGRFLQYELTMRTNNPDNFRQLAETLRKFDNIDEFSVMPTGE